MASRGGRDQRPGMPESRRVAAAIRDALLGCFGCQRPTSPHIDALAERGVVFRKAFTAAGRTVQLRAFLMTVVDADPGRDDRGEPPLPDELREHLRSLGYVGGSSAE